MVELNNEQKICLLLYTIQEAINDQSGREFEFLKGITPESAHNNLLKRLSSAQEQLASNKSSPGTVNILLRSIEEIDGRFIVNADVDIETKGYIFRQNITLNVEINGRRPTAIDLASTIDKISTLAEHANRETFALKDISSKSSSKAALSTTSVHTDKLILPRNIYGAHARFTSTVSQLEFGGNDIFDRPFGIQAFVWDDVYDFIDRDFLAISDFNWDRLVISSEAWDPSSDDWFATKGSHGTGPLQFKGPSGIATFGNRWIIADVFNNRALVHDLDWNTGDLTYQYEISNNFGKIVDVATYFEQIPGGGVVTTIAVLDQDYSKVHFYNYNGTFQTSLFSVGSGFAQLQKPTGLTFAKSRFGYDAGVIYVLDNGNKRVVRLDTYYPINHPSRWSTTESTGVVFPVNAFLCSIDVDNFGNVYVLDGNNGTIYVFNSVLYSLLATYGSLGTANNQLNYPHQLAITKGYASPSAGPNIPLQLGEMIVSESFGPQSGLRKYVLGCDILSHSMSYIPKPYTISYDWVKITYHQVGDAETLRKIFYGTTLLDSVYVAIHPPGTNLSWRYNLPDSALNGFYRFEITVKSIYDNTIQTTLIDSIYVTRSVVPGPRFTFEEIGIVDVFGGVPYYCLYPDSNKWWTAIARAKDNYFDSALTYYWGAISGIGAIYEDTTQPLWSFFVNTKDTMYFKLSDEPFGHNSGSLATIFKVKITTEPYDSNKVFSDYTWMDSVEYNTEIYNYECLSPCTPDCPIPDPGCPMLYRWDGTDYVFENNILPQSEDTEISLLNKIDFYPLYVGYQEESKFYKFKITEDENEISYFDKFELYTIEVPNGAGELIFNTRHQLGFLTGWQLSPNSAITNDGIDILDKVLYDDDIVFSSRSPGYVDVQYVFTGKLPPGQSLGEAPPGGDPIDPPPKNMYKVVTAPPDTEPNLYIVYARSITGKYNVIDRLFERRVGVKRLVELSDYVVKDTLRIRIEWTRGVNLDELAYKGFEKFGINEISVSKAILVGALHSSAGDVSSQLSRSRDQYVTLELGQEIELKFESPPLPESKRRMFLFKSTGWYEKISDSSIVGPTSDGGVEFEQNYPNPFNPSTTFKFSLSQTLDVKLEIYNVLGQRVAVLADRKYEAGKHTIEWNGRNDNGQQLATGVYFSKLTAGEFSETRKMVIVK